MRSDIRTPRSKQEIRSRAPGLSQKKWDWIVLRLAGAAVLAFALALSFIVLRVFHQIVG
jgi:hypothetical protein